SLADIVKMVHPTPGSPQREAFFGWLLGRDTTAKGEKHEVRGKVHINRYDASKLPPVISWFEAWKTLSDKDHEGMDPPEGVPFRYLTAMKLTQDHWRTIAGRMSWHELRQELNALHSKGIFDAKTTEMVAKKLEDKDTIKKIRLMPFQLLATYKAIQS